MKRSIIAAGALTAVVAIINIGTAFAQQSYTLQGTVISSQPIVAQQTKQIPTQTCNVVQVPVYGNAQQSNGGTLGLNNNIDIGGAIIGGIIGNNLTKGVENGGAAGALLGGLLGSQRNKQAQSNQIVGYRQEQRCATSYTAQTQEVVTGYEVAFEANGFQGLTRRTTPLATGAPITVKVTITAQ